jgi:hypothetical protein
MTGVQFSCQIRTLTRAFVIVILISLFIAWSVIDFRDHDAPLQVVYHHCALNESNSYTNSNNNKVKSIEFPSSFSPSLEMKIFCRNPVNCYRTECYAPLDHVEGGCLPNPFFRPEDNPDQKQQEEIHPHFFRRNSKYNKISDFTCPDRISQRSLLQEMELKLDQIENQDERDLWNFKKHSNWMFNKWYDWGGNCIKPPSNNPSTVENEQFIYRGYHDYSNPAAAGLYKLENVCIRPKGNLAGYKNFSEPMMYRSIWVSLSASRLLGSETTKTVVDTLIIWNNQLVATSTRIFSCFM